MRTYVRVIINVHMHLYIQKGCLFSVYTLRCMYVCGRHGLLHVRACMRVCMSVYVRICVCMHLCVRAYICVCLSLCVHMCMLSLQMRLYQQVKLLGGQALGDLTVKTTHLICGEVQSLKYKVRVYVRTYGLLANLTCSGVGSPQPL